MEPNCIKYQSDEYFTATEEISPGEDIYSNDCEWIGQASETIPGGALIDDSTIPYLCYIARDDSGNVIKEN